MRRTAILTTASHSRISSLSFRNAAVSLGFGLVTGAAAGLIGVGGGEFRLPLLLYFFQQRPRTASAVNLLVGLLTVSLSVIRRWTLHQWDVIDVYLVLTLIIASVGGSISGARYVEKFSVRFLKQVIYVYLTAVGCWMIFETITQADHVLWSPPAGWKLVLGAIAGFAIASVSAAFGVAGGEMRIPVLMYLFAVPVQEAGTISLAASVPTVAAGAFTYRSLGHLPRQAVILALIMGLGSLGGVLIGTALLPLADKHVLKGALGSILLAATLALAWPDLRKVTPSQ